MGMGASAFMDGCCTMGGNCRNYRLYLCIRRQGEEMAMKWILVSIVIGNASPHSINVSAYNAHNQQQCEQMEKEGREYAAVVNQQTTKTALLMKCVEMR